MQGVHLGPGSRCAARAHCAALVLLKLEGGGASGGRGRGSRRLRGAGRPAGHGGQETGGFFTGRSTRADTGYLVMPQALLPRCSRK